eukprot:625601-Amphidinium_carterae.1
MVQTRESRLLVGLDQMLIVPTPVQSDFDPSHTIPKELVPRVKVSDTCQEPSPETSKDIHALLDSFNKNRIVSISVLLCCRLVEGFCTGAVVTYAMRPFWVF